MVDKEEQEQKVDVTPPHPLLTFDNLYKYFTSFSLFFLFNLLSLSWHVS